VPNAETRKYEIPGSDPHVVVSWPIRTFCATGACIVGGVNTPMGGASGPEINGINAADCRWGWLGSWKDWNTWKAADSVDAVDRWRLRHFARRFWNHTSTHTRTSLSWYHMERRGREGGVHKPLVSAKLYPLWKFNSKIQKTGLKSPLWENLDANWNFEHLYSFVGKISVCRSENCNFLLPTFLGDEATCWSIRFRISSIFF